MWWTRKEQALTPDQSKYARRNRHSAGRRRHNKDEGPFPVAETTSGIEVSLPNMGSKSTLQQQQQPQEASPCAVPELHSPAHPFLSVAHVLAERRKVHRAQFAATNWSSGEDINAVPKQFSLQGFGPRNHRVPLFGSRRLNTQHEELMFDDAKALLRNKDVSNELQCLRDELEYLDAEITFLLQDRDDIEKCTLRLSPRSTEASPKQQKQQPKTDAAEHAARASCLTFLLQKEQLREALLTECGCRRQLKPTGSSGALTIRPADCHLDGAASIQHICFVQKDQSTSLFVSTDDSTTCHGRLPQQLASRLIAADYDCNELLYLTTGPGGAYFAEFRSGECWWAVPDDELDVLCREWEAPAVVLGPTFTVRDKTGRAYATPSWIIVARDGRVAWKNLPARLHENLQGRVASEAAPAEVALGYGDSYFVRFLDGSVDYNLPAHIVEILEQRGGKDPTSVYMHPELPGDFVIRHGE